MVNARFGTLLGGMHILVLTVLATSALTGGYRWRWRSALRFAAITLLLVAGVVGGARLAFAVWIDTTYRKAEVIGEMQLLYDAAPAVVHREAGAIPAPKQAPGPDDGRNRVERIADRGTLRVCYPREDLLPFVFFNARDELVGLDVELAHSLAQGLEVSLEFVPVDDSFQARRVSEALVSDVCDIGMTRSPLSMIQHGRVDYSKPYLNVNWAFLVRDHRRHEFAFRDEFELRDDLRVAIPNDPYHVARMARHLPSAELVPVATVQDFLDAEEGAFDAMIYPAEAGSAWSLLRPEFAVVVPDPPFELLPASFLVPSGELAWLNTVNSWITLKQSDGTVQELYDYWILGRATERRAPRWSVLRNVLGWVD